MQAVEQMSRCNKVICLLLEASRKEADPGARKRARELGSKTSCNTFTTLYISTTVRFTAPKPLTRRANTLRR